MDEDGRLDGSEDGITDGSDDSDGIVDGMDTGSCWAFATDARRGRIWIKLYLMIADMKSFDTCC